MKKRPQAEKRLCERQLISLREIAENWDCSRSTVARLLESAGIFPFDFTGSRNGTKRFLKEKVDLFMEESLRKEPQECLTDKVLSRIS